MVLLYQFVSLVNPNQLLMKTYREEPQLSGACAASVYTLETNLRVTTHLEPIPGTERQRVRDRQADG